LKIDNIQQQFKKEMNAAEKKKLYQAIGYEEDVPVDLPSQFNVYNQLY